MTTIPLDFPPLWEMAAREAHAYTAALRPEEPDYWDALHPDGRVAAIRAMRSVLSDLTTSRARDAWCHELARRAGETTEHGYVLDLRTTGLRLACDFGRVLYTEREVPGITAVDGLIPRLRLAILAMEAT